MFINFVLCNTFILLLFAWPSLQERCEPYAGLCNDKVCPENGTICKYEDPFYCGCCPEEACLNEEGEPCGGKHGNCGQGLQCHKSNSENDDGVCIKCDLNNEVCSEEMEKCPEQECVFGEDPLACSCCQVCLKGPGESCNEDERCTFYAECVDGKCKVPGTDETNLLGGGDPEGQGGGLLKGLQSVGAEEPQAMSRQRVCYRRRVFCRIYFRHGRYRMYCRYIYYCRKGK